jgi:NAD(P)H dehydrogenase (quinone)
MVIVGLSYDNAGLASLEGIRGSSPYGAATIAGGDGSLQPNETDLTLAQAQGKRVAELAKKLSA